MDLLLIWLLMDAIDTHQDKHFCFIYVFFLYLLLVKILQRHLILEVDVVMMKYEIPVRLFMLANMIQEWGIEEDENEWMNFYCEYDGWEGNVRIYDEQLSICYAYKFSASENLKNGGGICGEHCNAHLLKGMMLLVLHMQLVTSSLMINFGLTQFAGCCYCYEQTYTL